MPIHHWDFGGILETLQSERNRWNFALRNFLHWKGLPYSECAESVEAKELLLLEDPAVTEQAQVLKQRYDLQRVEGNASASRYLETLTYLDWLTCFYEAAPDAFQAAMASSSFQWLDVGAKNWSYVEALISFIHNADNPLFNLTGLELDPHRRYTDFRTRQQYAEAYLAQLPEGIRGQVRYQVGNILHWRHPVSIISHFLPFIFKEPHLAWGLPLKTFEPEAILQHELTCLQSQGLLLIVNQGEAEAIEQQRLFSQLQHPDSIVVKNLGQLPTRFIKYQYPRYGWLCIKTNDDP